MRTIRLLIMGALCLLFFAVNVNAQDMQKKISLKADKVPLSEVLNQLQEKYNIRFSYLNNDISADTIFNFNVHEKPLSEVLDVLLEKSGAGYKQLNGQIIIKKGLPKNKSARNGSSEKEMPQQMVRQGEGDSKVSLKPAGPFSNSNAARTDSVSLAEKEVENHQKDMVPVEPLPFENQEKSSLMASQDFSTTSSHPAQSNHVETGEQAVKPAEKDSLKQEKKGIISFDLENLLKKRSGNSKPDSLTRVFHLGLVYPISTNGRNAYEFTNSISFHGLIGASGGLNGVEISGIGNISRDSVIGVQIGGVFNSVGEHMRGAQFAGVVNRNLGIYEGAQFSGAININKESFGGGAQFAGFGNYTFGNSRGFSAGGFMNLADNHEGIQLAGFLNIADTVEGTQIAGFLNTASTVSGVQLAGFINRARYLKGIQIGFINIADSVSGGVPIGFLSFVKNGYRAVEVYSGEDFEANINLKVGVKRFYNIFALGAEISGNQRSGFGYGVGSEWTLGKRFYLNTDALSYFVNESSYTNFPDGFFEDSSVNILNKFRLLAHFRIGQKFGFFGGPTYNVFVSRYQETPEGPIGSGLVNKVFFDQTNRGTNVKMWIGFNAGIRF